MTREEAKAMLLALAELPPETLRRVLAGMPEGALRAIVEEWWWQARGGQVEPAGEWRTWSIVAGRGFGKTRTGAEWVSQRARENPGARIALVAASFDEVARVMVEGESGLLAVARSGERIDWQPSRGLVTFESGAVAFAYSADRPAMLRGPQHHFAWCDELAKWPRAEAAWDNLMLGLRLEPVVGGGQPRALVTTTPQPVPILKRIMTLKRSVTTRGRTADNPFSAEDYREAVMEMYAGTRLGRQELDGEFLEEPDNALWTREILDAGRAETVPEMARVVVGVDPPAGAGGTCGIVVCGMGKDGTAYVLGDHSVTGLRPEGWARKVAVAAEAWDATRVVAEKNQGGEMVESVLRAAASDLPVKLVSATRGKAARAEPIALRFETGKARLAARFSALEDELCALTYAGYEGGSASPDRADAMVWAMSELFERQRAEPRITSL